MLIPEHRTPIDIPSTTHDANTFRSRHENYHGLFLSRRPKSNLIRSTITTLSRSFKTNEEWGDCETCISFAKVVISKRDRNGWKYFVVDNRCKADKKRTTSYTCHSKAVKTSSSDRSNVFSFARKMALPIMLETSPDYIGKSNKSLTRQEHRWLQD